MDGWSPKVLDLVCQSLFSSDKRRVGTDFMLVDAICIYLLTFTFINAYSINSKKRRKQKKSKQKKKKKKKQKQKLNKQLLNVRRLSLYYPVIGQSLDIVSLSFT